MINSEEINIESLVLHKVGNKQNEDGINFSDSPMKVSDDISELLIKYFLSPFKQNEYYNLCHESDLMLNEVFCYVSKIFDDPEQLYEQSRNIAKHLYEQSMHPKVKPGELYVVYLSNCLVEGEITDAIGLFKSESKETYLKVYPEGEGYGIDSDSGVNINKLDKGCVIFNTEREGGYLLHVVDNLSKKSEARFWFDDFLNVIQRVDETFYTENVIEMCKDFVTEKMPQDYDVNKADQAELLNKSSEYIKEKERFDINEYAKEVLEDPEVVDSFIDYKNTYQEENQIEIEEDFEIAPDVVKKKARTLRSVIKLDKNFSLYVHGDRKFLERGEDPDSGLYFYKLYFQEES